MKNRMTCSQNGNLFLAIFGAIALAGVLGGGVIAFSKGPVQKAITMTKKNSVEAEMSILGQLAIMAAANQTNRGDCDGDSYVEPPEWRLVSGTSVPTNGGLIPNTIGASKIDPWGTQYGYCVWDSGPISQDVACKPSGNNKRLQGNDSRIYPVIAVISAGEDKTFTTICRNFSTGADKADQNGDGDLEDVGDFPLVAKAAVTDDDVIYTYTYEGAMSTAGGLWKLKSTDATTAYIDKKIEALGAQVLGTGTFERMVAIGGDFVDVISGLKLAGASQVPTCNVANTNVFRRLTSSMGIEMCNGTSWIALGGGSATASSIDGFADGITSSTNYFIGQNAGNTTLTGTKNTAVGMKTLSGLTTSPGATSFGIETAKSNLSNIVNTAGYRAGFNLSGAGASANTAIGAEAYLGSNTGGFRNTAVGYRALRSISNVGNNVAVGSMALMNQQTGGRNSAAGFEAGKTALSGLENVLIGYQVAKDTSILRYNTVVGSLAFSGSGAATKEQNVAIGAKIMTAAAGTGTASNNVAIGTEALRDLASGSRNTAMGYRAGQFLSNQNEIVAVGTNTGYYGSDGNVSVGYDSQYNATGARNTAIAFSGATNITSGTDNTTVGNNVNTSTGSHNTAIGFQAMFSSVSGSRNTALGRGALWTAGDDNVGIGDGSFRNATSGAPSGTTFVGSGAGGKNTTSNNSTAVGRYALGDITTGTSNTAFGHASLPTLTSGGNNTALGYESGYFLTGNGNTALGKRALRNNVTGSENTAIGNQAMQNTGDGPNTCVGTSSCNYAGPGNTALGVNTLASSTYGASYNTAAGFQALSLAGANATLNTAIGVQTQPSLTTGLGNTSIGMQTMYAAVTSNASTAVGQKALYANTTNEIVAVGYQALGSASNASGNTAFGGNVLSAVTTNPANRNTAFGYGVLSGMNNTSAANNAVMGNSVMVSVVNVLGVTVIGQNNAITNAIQNSTALGGAGVSASNTIRFGNTAITAINGQVAFTVASDRRLKRDIHPTDLGLDFILKLKPVSYRLIDGNGRLDYGFLAQDVEEALEGRKTNMVTRRNDKDGTYRMRHDDLIAPLVRAVQEQQEMLEDLEREADSLN